MSEINKEYKRFNKELLLQKLFLDIPRPRELF